MPYGDCFHIEERWLVEALPPLDGAVGGAGGGVEASETTAARGIGGRCRVSVAAVVQFTKSTMWRKMIEDKSQARASHNPNDTLPTPRAHLFAKRRYIESPRRLWLLEGG